MLWQLPHRTLDLGNRGEIMGILNVTPDSFSDGGDFVDTDAAVAHALRMIDQGAGIIDIGGESTRPGAAAVSAEDEIARTLPVITALRAKSDISISIDTSKASVAEAAIAAGADIVNDVTGLTGDPEMLPLCARTDVGIVIMHMQGSPRTMQDAPVYDDVVTEIAAFFQTQLDTCTTAGIEPARIVFDPGIGFGKTLTHNLTLLRDLVKLPPPGRPLLIGVSRKSFIGTVLGSSDLADREWPTVALTSHTRLSTARIFRVHDVLPNSQALRMTEAILHTP